MELLGGDAEAGKWKTSSQLIPATRGDGASAIYRVSEVLQPILR